MNKLNLLALTLFLSQYMVFAHLISKENNQMDENTKQHLGKLAVEARKKAYAPYSRYYVGSALMTSHGDIFQGCNIENASYGLTCCSERVAIFKAVSEGMTDFIAIAVATKDGGFPCGACRQVLNEFNPHLIVLICNEQGHLIRETILSTLLPNAFGPHNLN